MILSQKSAAFWSHALAAPAEGAAQNVRRREAARGLARRPRLRSAPSFGAVVSFGANLEFSSNYDVRPRPATRARRDRQSANHGRWLAEEPDAMMPAHLRHPEKLSP